MLQLDTIGDQGMELGGHLLDVEIPLVFALIGLENAKTVVWNESHFIHSDYVRVSFSHPRYLKVRERNVYIITLTSVDG